MGEINMENYKFNEGYLYKDSFSEKDFKNAVIKYAANIIYKEICYIHLEIEIDNALIRLRNRKNQHGRLPKIKSDKKLLEALYFQNGIFYYCDELLNRLEIKNKYKVDNSLDEKNLKRQLFETIKNCETTKENIMI